MKEIGGPPSRIILSAGCVTHDGTPAFDHETPETWSAGEKRACQAVRFAFGREVRLFEARVLGAKFDNFIDVAGPRNSNQRLWLHVVWSTPPGYILPNAKNRPELRIAAN